MSPYLLLGEETESAGRGWQGMGKRVGEDVGIGGEEWRRDEKGGRARPWKGAGGERTGGPSRRGGIFHLAQNSLCFRTKPSLPDKGRRRGGGEDIGEQEGIAGIRLDEVENEEGRSWRRKCKYVSHRSVGPRDGVRQKIKVC
eukprot:765990-Hanusia_phi.AAC.5